MKVKTIKRFRDLKEKKVREVGDEFEVTQKRFDEIQKVGNFVVDMEEKQTGEEKDTPVESAPEVVEEKTPKKKKGD